MAAATAALGVRVLDDHTLEYRFTKPAPYFPAQAAVWGTIPLRQDLIEAGGPDWWANPATRIGNGPFRLVAYVRAETEPEMTTDPLLGPVAWSWLTESLDAHGAQYLAAGGTVTRAVSEGFGNKDDDPVTTELELRASWSPQQEDLSAHVAAWCDMLCLAAGIPPLPSDVAALPPRPPRREDRESHRS